MTELGQIKSKSESLNGEGYWTRAGTPTEAAQDVRTLLKIIYGSKNPKRRACAVRRNARR